MSADPTTVSGAFVFAGERLRADIWLDHAEVERRDKLRVEHRLTNVMLEALFVLPEGMAVPLEGVPGWARAGLQDAPDWALRRSGEHLVRTYRPPGTVGLVIDADPTRPLVRQVEALRWLARVAPRSVTVTDLRRLDAALNLAARNDMGVLLAEGPGAWWPLAPAPTRLVRSTAQRWLLAERAVSASAAARSAMP